MSYLHVYEPWPDAVDTQGLCGPLLAQKPIFTEGSNETNEITFEHPLDKWGKWARLVNGNLIKAEVPLRTVPEFDQVTGGFVTSLRRRTVKANATRAQRAVYNTPSAGIRMFTLEPGAVVYQNATYAFSGRYRIRWSGGYGYIDAAALDDAYTTVDMVQSSDWIENVIPSPKTREQLFRIRSVKPSNGGVTVTAKHVSYDQQGNLTNVAKGEKSLSVALAEIHYYMVDDKMSLEAFYEYRGENATETRDIADWSLISPIEALLSPSNGVAALWGLQVLRDNWSFTFLADAGRSRGFAITYGVNMLGVDYEMDTTDVIARICPVGQTSKGRTLIIPDGAYVVDGVTTTVVNGCITSPWGDPYPVPYVGKLDKGAEIKAAGTTTTQLNTAYAKLIRATRQKFTSERCDLPNVSLNVQFLRLGDTEEYKQYRDMQSLYLYDWFTARHAKLGLETITTANKIKWNISLERYEGIEAGSVRKNYARSRFAPWQVPGLQSLVSKVDTITSQI